MRQSLSFSFDLEKFIAALAYFASAVSDLTKLRAAKLFYFADKYHLTNYGRPILGDRYAALDFGPVPSTALNLIDDVITPFRLNGIEQPQLDALEGAIEVELGGKHPVLRARREPDLNVLSESDVEALDFAIKECGNLSITALLEKAHGERSWQEGRNHHWIDYRWFFDEDDEAQRDLLAHLEEKQSDESFVEALLEQPNIAIR